MRVAERYEAFGAEAFAEYPSMGPQHESCGKLEKEKVPRG